jgi:hypothetical protein
MSELSLSKIQRILLIDPSSVSARLTQESRKRFPTPDDGAGEPPIFMPAKLARYQFQN